MWYKLPDKLQMIVAKLVMRIGQQTNIFKLQLWGLNHYPIVIMDEEYEDA
jgi:hypothetical protein